MYICTVSELFSCIYTCTLCTFWTNDGWFKHFKVFGAELIDIGFHIVVFGTRTRWFFFLVFFFWYMNRKKKKHFKYKKRQKIKEFRETYTKLSIFVLPSLILAYRMDGTWWKSALEFFPILKFIPPSKNLYVPQVFAFKVCVCMCWCMYESMEVKAHMQT